VRAARAQFSLYIISKLSKVHEIGIQSMAALSFKNDAKVGIDEWRDETIKIVPRLTLLQRLDTVTSLMSSPVYVASDVFDGKILIEPCVLDRVDTL
jgi:hypothetical protein